MLLPVFTLALITAYQNEAYEWTQHRLAGVGFAAAFAAAFLFGRWHQGWTAALAALLALLALAATGAMVLAEGGLPGFHPLFAVAGVMVAAGYRWARRAEQPAGLEIIAVGFCSMLSFWAVARLSWWQPFAGTLAAWPNQFLFLGITALLVWLQSQMERSAAQDRNSRRWPGLVIDTVTLGVLAAVLLRTTYLKGDAFFPHHWSVYTAPADMVREGRVLLGEVPSQYGFLSTLLIAALPTDDRFTALFWLNVTTVWLSGLIVYLALRTWLARWWWQLAAGLISVCAVAFLCGDAPTQSGPMIYPSVGAVRFIWVHALLGFLLWRHRRRGATPDQSSRWVLWCGSTLWLLGVLWSVESAVYVTAAWLPAASLLAMRPAVEGLAPPARLRALFAGIARALGVTGLLLAAAVAIIAAYYHFGLSRAPDWRAYAEYATAFSAGFGMLPIEPQGGVWVLLLLHTALLALMVSLETDRQRSALSLVWAAWGALWAVSTYFISRSHANNIINLSPVLLLIVGLMGHAMGPADRRSFARPWIWLTVPSFVGATLWLVLTNPGALRRQLTGYSVEPHTSRLLAPTPPQLAELISHCQQVEAGPYSVIGKSINEVIKAETVSNHAHWLPVRSMPLFGPLPRPRRDYYLDAYHHRRISGWLIAPVDRDEPDLAWFFDYVDTRYMVLVSLEHKGWQAWYYFPRPDWPDATLPK